MKYLFSLLLAVSLVGCSSLVPKKVEFFQDKVQKYPEQTERQRELLRQTLQRAYQKSAQTVEAALLTNAATNVVSPAREAQRLVESAATTVGPPRSPAPASVSTEELATKLETTVAKFNETVQDFKRENDKNRGKKIEGTGWIEVGYVWWVGGIVAAVALLVYVGRLFLTVASAANPAASAGLAALNVVGSVASKGASAVVTEVESLASTIEKEVSDLGLKQKLLSALEPAQAAAAHTEATLQPLASK